MAVVLKIQEREGVSVKELHNVTNFCSPRYIWADLSTTQAVWAETDFWRQKTKQVKLTGKKNEANLQIKGRLRPKYRINPEKKIKSYDGRKKALKQHQETGRNEQEMCTTKWQGQRKTHGLIQNEGQVNRDQGKPVRAEQTVAVKRGTRQKVWSDKRHTRKNKIHNTGSNKQRNKNYKPKPHTQTDTEINVHSLDKLLFVSSDLGTKVSLGVENS